MRLLLIWANKDPETINSIKQFQDQGHRVVYWVSENNDDDYNLPGIVAHNHYQAMANIPARGVDISEFTPPSKDLIEKLYETESIVLTMMNKKYNDECVDERRHIYYNMVQYWHGVLKKFQIEAVVYPVVPHSIYDYIILGLAKIMGLKTVMFEIALYQGRMLLTTDYQKRNFYLNEALNKNKGKNFMVADLSPDIQDYWQWQTNMQQKPITEGIQRHKKESSGLRLLYYRLRAVWVSIKYGTLVRNLSARFKKISSNLKKEYENVQQEPDFNGHYIYFPLSYQHEYTTSPMGGTFVDQILAIEILSMAVPTNWLIYVKEHPIQWQSRTGVGYSSRRYEGYYRKIAKLKNVRLVPIKTDTHKLINHSKALSVVTGTAGQEALFRFKKPVLSFGYSWYRDCSGVFKVNSVLSCREALASIMAGFEVSEQSIINYLKSFNEASIKVWSDAYDILSDYEISRQEGLNNMVQAILSELARNTPMS